MTKAIFGSLFSFAVLLAPCPSAQAQNCLWQPWAADWSKLNTGPDLFPPNGVYNPTNWDYSFGQATVLNLVKDTPPGGGSYALHFFFDSQPPATTSDGSGSGGVYQEISVTPGVPIQYSYFWKGKGAQQYNWFEFMLINGHFSPDAADENPGNWIMRKRELANTSFGWQQLTDQSTEHMGSGGPTITPTGSVVTVVLKGGHNPTSTPGGMEVFFDNVVVQQNNGPNLVVNGAFEDAGEAPICDEELMSQDPTHDNYWFALAECPADQHTTAAPVSPSSHDNAGPTTMTITGMHLEYVTEATLVPVAGGPGITATTITVGPGPNEKSLSAVFPTAGAADGVYDVVTIQAPSPPCLVQTLAAAFEITCASPSPISSLSPGLLTNPSGPVQFTISGTNLAALTAVALEYSEGSPPGAIIEGTGLTMSGADLLATFDLACQPSGSYRLVGSRSDACRPSVLDNAFRLRKPTPPDACAWQPWTASWSVLNLGDDLDPPNAVFNPTNWDYRLNQATLLNTTRDTPPGGGSFALHWFLDSQPPAGSSTALGSGGVYQEIAVQPGVSLEYSFYWKGTAGEAANWFEFLLIDGPFSLGWADRFQEDSELNNPAMIRKRELTGTSFAWEQVTDQTPADVGPAGPRPQTIIPTGTVAAVVLKAGRYPAGGMESFWDNVIVRQSGGPNLLANGDFENFAQQSVCEDESMFQDPCEFDYWRRSSFKLCPDPFADADEDGDVDQTDFAMLQLCYTGSAGPVPEGCGCLNPNGDGVINQADVTAFVACASGPGVPADITCDD